MEWQEGLSVLPTFAGAVTTAAIALYSLRHRKVRGAAQLAWLMLAITEWSLASGLAKVSRSPEADVFWTKATFLGIAVMPVTALAFLLHYTGRDRWLTGRRLALLSAIPLVTQIVIWTNDAHGLFARWYTFTPEGALALTDEWVSGPWFWVHSGYSYALLLAGSAMLVLTAFHSPEPYRGQAVTLLFWSIVTLTVSVPDTFGWFPEHLSLMPLVPALNGLAFAWGVFRYRLLDLVPIARDILVDSTSDGMIVLDLHGRVVDVNPAALELLGLTAEQAIGRPAERALSGWPDLLERLRDTAAEEADAAIGEGEAQRHVNVRISPLTDRRGRLMGRMVVWRDITDRKRAVEALRESEARYRSLFEDAPTALWEEDFSAVKRRLDALRSEGVTDFRAHFERHPEVVAECVALARVLHVNQAALRMTKASDQAELLAGLDRVIPPEASRFFQDELARIAEGQTQFDREGINHTLTGEPLEVHMQWSVVPGHEDTLARVLVALEDVTESRRMARALQQAHDELEDRVRERTAELTQALAQLGREMVERKRAEDEVRALNVTLEQRVGGRTRELSALYEVSAVASRALTLRAMLAEALAQTATALQAEAGAVFLMDESRGDPESAPMRLSAHLGIPPTALADMEAVPANSPWLGAVIAQRDPLLVPDTSADARLPRGMREAGALTLLLAPMQAEGRVLGVVGVARECVQGFSLEEMALLTSIADQLGVAVQNDRRRQWATVLEERQRLARDLHDSVTQSLYGLVALTEAGQATLEAGTPETIGAMLAPMGQTARRALREMRLFIHEMQPPELESEGLAGALLLRLAAVEGRSRVSARLVADEDLRLSPAVENALYHIAQEALNNCLRHADAATVTVRLRRDVGQVVLEIDDDGQGFDPERVDRGGAGLRNMHERAAQAGGVLRVTSRPGAGTRVSVRVAQES